MALSDTVVLRKDMPSADPRHWEVDFLEYPPPLPSHLDDICTGSWEYFSYVHGSSDDDKKEEEKDEKKLKPQRSATATASSTSTGIVKRPRKVNIRYHVHDIKDINEVAGTVYIDFSVQCTWTDPVIAHRAKQIQEEMNQQQQQQQFNSNNDNYSTNASPSNSSPSTLLRRNPSVSPKLLRTSSVGGGIQNTNNGGGGGGGTVTGSSIFLLTTTELNDIWLPDISVPNALESNNFSSTLIRIRDPLIGKIEQRLRYHGLINNRMDLRCFPFDADLLLFSITSSFPSSQVLLVPDPLFPVDKTYIRHNLTEWEVDPLPTIATGLTSAMGDSVFSNNGNDSSTKERIDDIVTSTTTTGNTTSTPTTNNGTVSRENDHEMVTGDANSTCHLVLKVHRNPFFYLWKMVAVQEIVAMWSWTVFYHDPDDIPGRMSTTLTLFLSSVAFLHVINDRLPRMPYLTVLDKFTYISFFLLFLTAYENLCVYYASHHMHNRELAVVLDVFARFAFPLLHIASCIALYIQVRNSRQTELKLGNEL